MPFGSGGGGGGTFNGGTITTPLVVDASAGLQNGVKVSTIDAGSAGLRVTDAVSLTDLFKVNTDGDLSINGIPNILAGSGSLSISGSNDSTPNQMLLIQKGNGDQLFSVRGDGAILQHGKAAPATGAMDPSTFALWLDDTPGATKLMVKATDSGGTVRTATIALA